MIHFMYIYIYDIRYIFIYMYTYTVFQKKFTLLLFAITKSDVDRF